MKTHLRRASRAQSQEVRTARALVWEVCNSPEIGELLPEYIADLLADSVAEAVEDHLLDCLYCRENYLKVLSIAEAARRAKGARSDEGKHALQDECAPGAATVLNMTDFKKRRP